MTDENPYDMTQAKMDEHNFQCPIDEADAMARILDPVRLSIELSCNTLFRVGFGRRLLSELHWNGFHSFFRCPLIEF